MASEVKCTFFIFSFINFCLECYNCTFCFYIPRKSCTFVCKLILSHGQRENSKNSKIIYLGKYSALRHRQDIGRVEWRGRLSVSLLDILLQLGYDCIACHCNFQLRGNEAVRDRNFAYEMAQKLGVAFYETVFDTNKYAAEKKVSIEMACRELRYEWFEKLRCELGARWIAVAHHRDDSVETMLMNLIRGTGIVGLCGIQPVYGRVIRPLLSLSRKDIEDYLSFRQLPYVVDSTNREDNYTRNKIRLHVLPLLQSVNPAVPETIVRTMDHS